MVIDQTDSGVFLRFGKYHRRTQHGVNWKIPFIDEVRTATSVITTMQMSTQTLTTSDDTTVVVSAIVKYAIQDAKPYLLEIWDAEDVLQDVTQGAVKKVVSDHPYRDLNHSDIEKLVLKSVRGQVNKYGFKIHNVTFSDFGRIKSLRLMMDSWESSE